MNQSKSGLKKFRPQKSQPTLRKSLILLAPKVSFYKKTPKVSFYNKWVKKVPTSKISTYS